MGVFFLKTMKGGGELNYTYMVLCKDNTLYTGWTNDLEKRLAAHNAGTGAKYTKTRRPVRMVYAEEHEEKRDAMRREAQIKRLSRGEKVTLISSAQNILK